MVLLVRCRRPSVVSLFLLDPVHVLVWDCLTEQDNCKFGWWWSRYDNMYCVNLSSSITSAALSMGKWASVMCEAWGDNSSLRLLFEWSTFLHDAAAVNDKESAVGEVGLRVQHSKAARHLKFQCFQQTETAFPPRQSCLPAWSWDLLTPSSPSKPWGCQISQPQNDIVTRDGHADADRMPIRNMRRIYRAISDICRIMQISA